MRPISLCLAAAFLAISIQSAPAQQVESPSAEKATVVFFTPGGHWRGTVSQLKTPLYGKADIPSMGTVFDGQDRIATLSHSRYLVLQLAPGHHHFSANLNKKKPSAKETLDLDLRAGEVSFVAVTTTLMNYAAGIVATLTSHIESASCDEFRSEMEKTHLEPALAKHIEEKRRKDVSEALPESCMKSSPFTP